MAILFLRVSIKNLNCALGMTFLSPRHKLEMDTTKSMYTYDTIKNDRTDTLVQTMELSIQHNLDIFLSTYTVEM